MLVCPVFVEFSLGRAFLAVHEDGHADELLVLHGRHDDFLLALSDIDLRAQIFPRFLDSSSRNLRTLECLEFEKSRRGIEKA